MDEFFLIESFFKSIPHMRPDVLIGIGDDAACLRVPVGKQLLVSSDTLVADVHFHANWDAYAIAYKAVMVNVSDIAAMGGTPCWLTLALTLPCNTDDIERVAWLTRFSAGLRDALHQVDVALVGGDITRGHLSMTLTIHGLVDEGKAIRRNGARPGDIIYASGELGGAAFALASSSTTCDPILLKKLQYPLPRIDLGLYLQTYATAAIDISDGLLADLNHICVASQVGAHLDLAQIPLHPLITPHAARSALDFALNGGDDYELCFTIPPHCNKGFLASLAEANLVSYPIGTIEEQPGLRASTLTGETIALDINGYKHF